ncbi:MAG: Tim44/TimA family putative adaptor protein [Hyphomicrobiales bacterium]
MNNFLDIYSIIFLVLAVVIFLKLRSVLGKRTGNEKRPYDPFANKPEEPNQESGDNVITLPRANGERTRRAEPADVEEEAEVRLAGAVEKGSAAEAALRTVMSADRSFDVKGFLEGARMAYEMIVTAFADGERKALKNLLAKDVYDGFVAAIADRESRGERIDSTFIGIDKAEIVEAEVRDGAAQITVRFVSQLITATRDKAGAIVDGDPNKITEVTDIWTFAREVASRNPNWKLIATESAE